MGQGLRVGHPLCPDQLLHDELLYHVDAGFGRCGIENPCLQVAEADVFQTVKIASPIVELFTRDVHHHLGGVGLEEDGNHLQVFGAVNVNCLVVWSDHQSLGMKAGHAVHVKRTLPMKYPFQAAYGHNHLGHCRLACPHNPVVMHVWLQHRGWPYRFYRNQDCLLLPLLHTKIYTYSHTCKSSNSSLPLPSLFRSFSDVSISVKIHKLSIKKKTPISILLTRVYQWTSQGLNLGPPDYESRKVIFHEILLFVSIADYQRFTKLSSSLNLKKYP